MAQAIATETFVMVSDEVGGPGYFPQYLWKLFIDQRYQGRGYGTATLDLIADYFRQAALLDGVKPDPRLADAIELIRAARQPDGRWLQAGPLPGRVWFDVDAPAGEPSKWLTLSAIRVLTWWNSHPAP